MGKICWGCWRKDRNGEGEKVTSQPITLCFRWGDFPIPYTHFIFPLCAVLDENWESFAPGFLPWCRHCTPRGAVFLLREWATVNAPTANQASTLWSKSELERDSSYRRWKDNDYSWSLRCLILILCTITVLQLSLNPSLWAKVPHSVVSARVDLCLSYLQNSPARRTFIFMKSLSLLQY